MKRKLVVVCAALLRALATRVKLSEKHKLTLRLTLLVLTFK